MSAASLLPSGGILDTGSAPATSVLALPNRTERL